MVPLARSLSREERLAQLQQERAYYQCQAALGQGRSASRVLEEEAEALWTWKTARAAAGPSPAGSPARSAGPSPRPGARSTTAWSTERARAVQREEEALALERERELEAQRRDTLLLEHADEGVAGEPDTTTPYHAAGFREVPSYREAASAGSRSKTAARRTGTLGSVRSASTSPRRTSLLPGIPARSVISYAMKNSKDTDHPLLLLLRQERQKYVALETSYHALQAKVASLQTDHLQERRAEEHKFQEAVDQLQHELDLKLRDCDTYRKEASVWKSRFARDARVEVEEVGKLGLEVTSLKASLEESTAALQQEQANGMELRALKAELLTSLGIREAEVRKLTRSLREREEEVISLNKRLITKDEDLIQANKRIANMTIDLHAAKQEREQHKLLVAENDALKHANARTKRALEELLTRERKYLADIKDSATREAEIFRETKELAAQHQEQTRELRETRAARDQAETALRILRSETEELQHRLAQQQQDHAVMVAALPQQLHAATQEGEGAARTNFDLELSTIQRVVQELEEQLSRERARQEELKATQHQKLLAVGEKIVSLQDALSEAQVQIASLDRQDGEKRVELESKVRHISDLEAQLAQRSQERDNLARSLKAEKREVEEQRRARKQGEKEAEERASAAQAALHAQLEELRSQLALKKSQISQLSQEHKRVNASSDQMGESLVHLEARLKSMQAAESARLKQVAELEARSAKKDQEIQLLILKSESLHEQIALLQEELRGLRSLRLGKEPSAIHNSVTELSKRLKGHVDSLLDTSERRRSRASSPVPTSPSLPSPLGGERRTTFAGEDQGLVEANDVDVQESGYGAEESLAPSPSYAAPPVARGRVMSAQVPPISATMPGRKVRAQSMAYGPALPVVGRVAAASASESEETERMRAGSRRPGGAASSTSYLSRQSSWAGEVEQLPPPPSKRASTTATTTTTTTTVGGGGSNVARRSGPRPADASALTTYKALRDVLGDSFMEEGDREQIIAGLEDFGN